MYNKYYSIIAIFLLSLTLITACSKEIETPETRSISRWEALINKNWEKAYSFETPGYRKSFTLEQFKLRFGGIITWKEIKFIDISYTNKKLAEVKLDLLISFSPPGGGDVLMPGLITEKWLLQDGGWWFVPKK